MSKKGGKKGAAVATDGEEIVMKYMQAQNRPFSVQNVVDALQKDNVKKAAVDRALASLVEQNAVVCKEYGKSKIYLCCQSSIELPTEEEMAAMETEITEKTEQDREWDTMVAGERQEVELLKSELTEQQAKERLEQLARQIVEFEAKLEKLGDPKNLPTQEEMDHIKMTFFQNKAAWKKRKRMTTDIVGQICEGLDKKPKVLMQELGMELDEDVNANIDALPNIEDPAKKRKIGLTKKPMRVA